MIEDLIEKVANGELTESQAVDEMIDWHKVKNSASNLKSRIGTAWKEKRPAFQKYVASKITQLKTSAQNVGNYFANKLGAK